MTDTTMHRASPRQRPSDPPTEVPPKLQLSATQLVGGALAAMTAAMIGARLGVAGTVLGAAIGSVVAGVAGTLYTASLKHTKSKLSSALVGRVGDTRVEVAPVSEPGPARSGWETSVVPTAGVSDDTLETPVWDKVSWAPASNQPTSADTASADTASWDTPGGWTMEDEPAAWAPASTDPVATAADLTSSRPRRRQLPWKPILLSAAAVFVIAFAAITGYELVSGQSLSGGTGTTITQVGEGRGKQTPADAPSSDTSADPSASAEPSQDAAPSSEPTTSQPSAGSEPSQTSEPSTGTTESADPSTSSEPTAPADPDQAAPERGPSAGADPGVAGG